MVTAWRSLWQPMLITVITNVAFFVAYWLPEFGRGAADPLLGQLAPLASASFATGGEVWYATQRGTGTWMLIFGVAIAWLVRSRFWLARLIVFPISYLGAALALVMVVGLIVRGELFDSLLSVLLSPDHPIESSQVRRHAAKMPAGVTGRRGLGGEAAAGVGGGG
ncbi:hypothetical protein [Microlunatus speluncae]|uniref:hypothetical protein n=1 Tax=Microlunatus speluncae TaxID=2594267 RepID=UPI00126615D3|nr:hypothetical protein [Microlunatus speluncae]